MQNDEPIPYGKDIPKEHRDWAMFAHLSALAGYIFSFGYLNFVGPLVIWLLKREEMPFVEDQAKESLNFQITMFIGLILSVPLMFVLIGFLTAIAVWIMGLVFTIIAAIKAQEGVPYRYPLCIRIIQ